MSLRTRIALASAIAVALAIVLGVFAAYSATSSTLHDQIDTQLVQQADQALHRFSGQGPFGGPQAGDFGGAGGFVQIVNSQGQTVDFGTDRQPLPVAPSSAAVAQAGTGSQFGSFTTGGVNLRVLAVPIGQGLALQIAQPLSQIDTTLAHLRQQLILISLAGIALAAIAGALIGARGIRPVRALATSVDFVTRTGDLSHRIPVNGDDEAAQLAARFNAMLESLEQARSAQDQLVADASHELRTPLTALRANVELLASGAVLPPDDHRRLIDDVTVQLDEFGGLVGDLMLLARGERTLTHPVPVALDEITDDAVARARAWWPDAQVTVTTTPTQVMGDPDALARAVANLIDNAIKHGGGTVEVAVAGGAVRVRDFGAGIPVDDQEQVFARFWRGAEARALPGSGLGLAIVAQVAAAHDGTITIAPHEGPGTLMVLQLPHHGETPAPA